MSGNLPSSLTKCIEKKDDTFGDYVRQAVDLAKATGMDQKCIKESETQLFNAEAHAKVVIASAGSSITAFNNAMKQSGCGQVTLNLNNQRNAISAINCQIQKSSSTVIGNVSSSNSLSFVTLPLTEQEVKMKSLAENTMISLQRDLVLTTMNSNLDSKKIEALTKLIDSLMATNRMIIDGYDRSLTFESVKISQSIKSSMKASIVFNSDAAQEITNAQKTLAKSVAETDLTQKLGVNALTDNQKSVISNNIENSNQFTTQNVQETLNSVQLKLDSNNNLVMSVAGPINLKNTVIDQNITSTMVMDALIGQCLKSGIMASTSVISDVVSKSATGADVKGLDDLLAAAGKNNKDMQGDSSMFIIVGIILLVIFGSIFGVFKFGGSVVQHGFNNIIIVLGLVSLIVGVIFFIKGGVGNIILGSILSFVGVGLMIFFFIMRARMSMGIL
jgi:hypothetical protein